MYTPKEQKFMLKLARDTIAAHLGGHAVAVNETDVPANLLDKKGCFVTLTIDGALRGCIGEILPQRPLWQAVRKNAISAAFDDPRFQPLEADELPQIKIEVSVLSVPEPLEYDEADDLVRKLGATKPGVFIKKSFYGATFLPQVWDDLKQPEDFLSHLCAKAGLAPDEWQDPGLSVETYTVDKFEED